MGKRRGIATAASKAFTWMRRQSRKVQISAAAACVLILLVALKLLVREKMYFFVASASIHCVGILVLIYKLSRHKTCSGLSLKTQELTAIFVAVRLISAHMVRTDLNIFIVYATLASTLWVIYMMRFKLKPTYNKELDNMPLYYVVVPTAILGILIHPPPHEEYRRVICIAFAFSMYLESVSVLPQLRMMQKTKMIEPFTAHYVFALGVARFLSFAHWVIAIYESASTFWYVVGAGYIWLPVMLLAEIVQTFILADFCYYYIKSVLHGQLIVSIPIRV